MLAAWQCGVGGLAWIEELVASGRATALGDDGYPFRYTATAQHLANPIIQGPPEAHETWIRGPSDTVTDQWQGKTTMDAETLAACPADQWLIIEAWDES